MAHNAPIYAITRPNPNSSSLTTTETPPRNNNCALRQTSYKKSHLPVAFPLSFRLTPSSPPSSLPMIRLRSPGKVIGFAELLLFGLRPKGVELLVELLCLAGSCVIIPRIACKHGTVLACPRPASGLKPQNKVVPHSGTMC